MKRMQQVVTVVVCSLMVSWLMPTISQAEEPQRTREMVEARLLEGGWQVLYGAPITQSESAAFLYAVSVAAQLQTVETILDNYFPSQAMENRLVQLDQEIDQLDRRAINQLVIDAFARKHLPLRISDNLEMGAGILAYQVSTGTTQEFPCFERISPTQLERRTCTVELDSAELVTYYLPYWRIRYNSNQPFNTNAPNDEVFGGLDDGPLSIDQPLPTETEVVNGLYFTNLREETVYLAIAYYDAQEQDWFSRGWFEIEPGERHRGYENILGNRYYAYYVQDGAGNPIISGERQYWVREGRNWNAARQYLRNDARQGYQQVPFLTLDTQGQRNFSVSIN